MRNVNMEWLTTSTLLDDLRDFDHRAAWGRFADRFRGPIVRFARGLGLAESEAEDVAQETLIAFARGLEGGQYDRSQGRLSQWLFGIAYRQSLNHRRRSARLHARESPGSGDSPALDAMVDEQTASHSWDEEWEQTVLTACMQQVRREVEETSYQAFELVVLMDRKPAEAAEMLEVPIKTIYNAKHRVLKRIRELRHEFERV